MAVSCDQGDAPGRVSALGAARYLGQDLVTTHQPGPHTSLPAAEEKESDIDAANIFCTILSLALFAFISSRLL